MNSIGLRFFRWEHVKPAPSPLTTFLAGVWSIFQIKWKVTLLKHCNAPRYQIYALIPLMEILLTSWGRLSHHSQGSFHPRWAVWDFWTINSSVKKRKILGGTSHFLGPKKEPPTTMKSFLHIHWVIFLVAILNTWIHTCWCWSHQSES